MMRFPVLVKVVPWGPRAAAMGPEAAPVSEMYTVRVVELARAGEMAMPFGWARESSTMETWPVEGRKR